MRCRIGALLVGGALGLSSFSVGGVAEAVELQAATGPNVQGSSWRGDAIVGSALKLGVRFREFFAIDALTRLGYATVDQRMVTYLSLGATAYLRLWDGKIRPFARLALVHQHEEPLSAVREDAFGALFGVGDGIRHRGGFGGSLGSDFMIAKSGKFTEFLVGADLNTSYFPDPRGPQLYFGGGLWAGLVYSL